MAKYIVIEDFESKWLKPPNFTSEVVIFPKGTIIQALPSPVDGKLKTRVDGTLPNFDMEGQIWVDVVENKVNMIKEEDANKIAKDKNMIKWLYLGGAAVMLWWFIYGRNGKKK